MFDLKAYRANKAAAKAQALALQAKAEAKAQVEESVKARAEKYATQDVSDPVKENIFGDYHTALGIEEGCKYQAEKAQKAQDAIDADKNALAKLEIDLDVIYGNVIDLQDKTQALRAKTKADKAEVDAKLEENALTSVADRIAKARAKKASPTSV